LIPAALAEKRGKHEIEEDLGRVNRKCDGLSAEIAEK
jgi:hypothetical protein